jgi:hypothetical protein
MMLYNGFFIPPGRRKPTPPSMIASADIAGNQVRAAFRLCIAPAAAPIRSGVIMIGVH